ncbi:MAG: hypothetical protein E6Q73_07810 [Pseudorhodobacter sp.]|nr:MAG: hypothetical protein E6Q73_07810 [Pseudorhodobacter sp.]
MSVSTTNARPLPLIGWIARDIGRDVNIVFYLLTIAVTVLVLAVKTWGLVALTMAALPMVPVMFGFFIWISLP